MCIRENPKQKSNQYKIQIFFFKSVKMYAVQSLYLWKRTVKPQIYNDIHAHGECMQTSDQDCILSFSTSRHILHLVQLLDKWPFPDSKEHYHWNKLALTGCLF